MTKTKIDAIETASNAIQTSHGSALLHTLARALATMMDGEANALCGAEYGQRSDERSNLRNGYRDRVLETRLGTVDLKIPKLREGSYLPSFLEPRRRWEQAFVSVVSEAYVRGVSTRKGRAGESHGSAGHVEKRGFASVRDARRGRGSIS